MCISNRGRPRLNRGRPRLGVCPRSEGVLPGVCPRLIAKTSAPIRCRTTIDRFVLAESVIRFSSSDS